MARLYALMGQERVGYPATVDTYRPGAFGMRKYGERGEGEDRGESGERGEIKNAIRRCRQPVPVRIALERDRPVRVTIDRRGYSGGAVVHAAGPWRVSGNWWTGQAGQPFFSREEWDVALAGGAVYRLFRDEVSQRWFLDGIYD